MKELDFKEKYNEVMERLKNTDTIVLTEGNILIFPGKRLTGFG